MSGLRWGRSEDGYTETHCGEWAIRPNFWGLCKAQDYGLFRGGAEVGDYATQRDAKAQAISILLRECWAKPKRIPGN